MGPGIAGMVSPFVLFSEQNEFKTGLDTGATAGVVVLLLLVAAKILASTWCMTMIFKGAPILPLTFAGGTPGLAVMAEMIVCALKAPVVVIPLVALIVLQREILIIAAVAAGYYTTRNAAMFPHEGGGSGVTDP